jgi:hypothetical protein
MTPADEDDGSPFAFPEVEGFTAAEIKERVRNLSEKVPCSW